MMFRIGEYVTWVSQPSGERRSGRVIEVVPVGCKPQTMKKQGGQRRKVSYVVEVERTTPNGLAVIERRKYWPRVTQLESLHGATRHQVYA